MSVARAAFGAHQVIFPVPFVEVRSFDAAPIGTAAPDALRIADNAFRRRIIFLNRDDARLFVAVAEFPFERHDVFPAVVVMQNRRVEADRIEIDRLAPGTADIRRRHEKIVLIEKTRIVRNHPSVENVKEFFALAPGEARSPDSLRRREHPEIERYFVG